MGVAGNLKSQRLADVPGQSGVDTGVCQNVMGQQRCCRLAVRAGYAYHFRIGVAAGELYLADYIDSFLLKSLDNGSGVGNSRALDNFVGFENTLHGVASLLPFYALFVEHAAISVGYLSIVAEEDFPPLVFGENSCADAAFAAAEHNHRLLLFLIHCH